MSLLICAAFLSKSSGKYLRYNVDEGAGAASRQLLRLNGDDAVNPYTRFYIEPSNKHDGFVHVRCCYNNKYWVAEQRPNGDEWWIAGSADQPEEDLSLQSCTLFQLKPVGEDTDTIRLMHARLGTYAGILSSNSSADRANNEAFQACLHVPPAAHLTLVKLPQMVLPKHVCFKGDNGAYLAAQQVKALNRLIFSAKDMEDPAARHTTVTNSDGTAMQIKSEGLGLFWRRRAAVAGDKWDWVLVDSCNDTDNDRDRFFQAFLSNDYNDDDDGEMTVVVGLLSLGNNLYCKRFTKLNHVTNGLAALEKDAATQYARIQLQEPVVSREITVVQFSLTQARLYDEEERALATASATNGTSSPATVKLTFEITLTEKQRWSSSVTLRSPVMTTMSSQVPSKVDDRGGVVVAGGLSSFNAMHSWGATNIKTSRETVVQFVVLPPMTRVTATCRAKTSSYDVPFSYRQADKLIGGQELKLEFEDGFYSGQNFHSLVYNYETESITI